MTAVKHVARMSEAASLAIHTMAVLTADPERTFTTAEVAEKLGVSVNHLWKVAARLEKAGLLESIRGRAGGIRLAAKGRTCTLLTIYEQVEGRFEAEGCLLGEGFCLGKNCALGGMLRRVSSEVRDYLAETTPRDLVEALKR